MNYYKIIGGVRYDRKLIEAADAYTQGRGEFRISLEEIQALYHQATDGHDITVIEHNTLLYISKHYMLTNKAITWLSEQLQTPEEGISTITERVIRQMFELPTLRVEIGEETVEQYLAGGETRNWEAVLQGAMEAFLHSSQGQLSFVACVARHDRSYHETNDQIAVLKSYLDRRAHLFLIPPDSTAADSRPYDLPHVLDPTNFWTFVLQLQDFEPVEFFAFVHRVQPFQYSRGQFSKKASLEKTIQAAVQQFARFSQMQWVIPANEIAKQLEIIPQQNFGNALFAALNTGIFNQESSNSFGDFVRQEVWPDPDTDISENMREYANTGVLHLIPIDYRAQTDAGTAWFPVPEQYSFWMDGEWVFGLEMPWKTHVRLMLTTPRDGNDGDTAWNEGFIDDQLSIGDRLQQVVTKEFNLEGMELRYDLDVFEAQRQQYGPEWRHLPGLLRQALNTLLHDYLTVNSMFNVVAKAHKEEVDQAVFDDPKAFHDAIGKLISDHLRTSGVIEMLPEINDENVFPFGEKGEDHWLVRAYAGNLADHYFWIVIPRWPNEDQRPYNYID